MLLTRVRSSSSSAFSRARRMGAVSCEAVSCTTRVASASACASSSRISLVPKMAISSSMASPTMSGSQRRRRVLWMA